MKFDLVEEIVRGIPYTSPERGRELYDFIIENRPRRCLELGFAHGVSLCYLAAALHEVGDGHIDGVDLLDVNRSPSAEELLSRAGLSSYVTLHREKSSYTWFLKKRIQELSVSGNCIPEYDFCFIDGPKNWTIDGAAFFMVDKLLIEKGTIVFDDYNYNYSKIDGVTDGISHRRLGQDELIEPHVKLLYHLLVMQHPSYGSFKVVNEQMAWATKTGGGDRLLLVEERIGAWQKAMRLFRRWRRIGS